MIKLEEKKYYLNSEISEELYLWLKNKAEKEKRSLTAQFVWELEQLKKGGAI